jgi:predicted outer membrane lipoprotein
MCAIPWAFLLACAFGFIACKALGESHDRSHEKPHDKPHSNMRRSLSVGLEAYTNRSILATNSTCSNMFDYNIDPQKVLKQLNR